MNNRTLKDLLYEQVARVGKALASPKRLEMLEMLAQGEKSVDALAEAVAVDIKLASAHLKALKEARLVVSRRDGKRMLYRLSGQDVAQLGVTLRQVAEEHLVELRLAVAPMQDILNQLTRFHPALIREEVRPYFRDVSDHAARINESTDAMREMLTVAMNVNLALVSVSQNEVVKRLAGWAALLAAPTLMTSWYGMNFHHMPELDKTWGYPGMIVLTLVICAGLYVVLRRAKWL